MPSSRSPSKSRPSSGASASKTTQSTLSLSTSTKGDLRFATVSTSKVTDIFIEAVRSIPGCQVVAVHSRNLKSAKAFADRHGVKRVYIDVEMMATYSEIDAVYIASPNSLHAEQALLFIRNGKHVLVEKPICSTENEMLKLQTAGKKYGVTVMECMRSTLAPNFQIAKEAIARLGAVHRFVGNLSHCDSRYSLAKKKKGDLPNIFNPAFCGGALMDLGVYPLTVATAFMGPISSVVASSPTLMAAGVDSSISLICEHISQSASSTSVITVGKAAVTSMGSEVQGEKGTMVIDDIITFNNIKIIWAKDSTEESLTVPNDLTSDDLLHVVNHFVDLIRGNKKQSSINTHEQSLSVMKALEQGRKMAGIKFPVDTIK